MSFTGGTVSLDHTNRVSRGAVVGIPAALAGAYWLCMSPWSQVLGRFTCRVAAKDRVIALSFDDGPNEPYTSLIADYLREQQVTATFFQVGSCVARHPEVARRLAADGHVIANHSMTHRFRHYLSQPRYRREIELSQAVITNAVGRTPTLFRPPWLWRGPIVFGRLHRHGLVAVSGEFCHSLEPLGISSARIARAALRKARPGKILIFHDGYNSSTADRTNTLEALKIVVPELRRRGYAFVSVSELLGIEPYSPPSCARASAGHRDSLAGSGLSAQ
jgi:peptidoglycan-N-acetylglucosamine deacetylase